MICPICLSTSQPSFEIKGYPIFKCQSCGHLFLQNITNINTQNELYGDSYFFGKEEGYKNYIENRENLIDQGHWYGDLIKNYRQPGLMLDVGAAAGYILKGFVDKGWSGIGIEPNPHMVDYGQKELGLHMEIGYIETYLTDVQFDLISLIQVVHHFYDIRSAFEKLKKLTKSQGFLLIETWKIDSLIAKIFGHKWHAFNPPSVRHWFTFENLENLIGQFGFKKIKQGRRFKKMKGSLLKNRLHPIFKSFIPNNANIIYPGDDLVWILFQKEK